jgi:hypothetical protein
MELRRHLEARELELSVTIPAATLSASSNAGRCCVVRLERYGPLHMDAAAGVEFSAPQASGSRCECQGR